MKFKIVTIFIALIFFIAQPASISKADLASDLLKKAQELAEKQKIKGKKLEAFILSNIITVDYEGKKQTYKFNKDITYNVYENSKVIGDGTWAIKGLTKSSIKLSGYRDIYFQIYNSKDKISTLTNLKKKSDGQTNRKILKISSLDDFEKQLTNSITKKEKKKVVKKEEVKKEEVKKEEVKKVVKKEEINSEDNNENIKITEETFKKNPNNLPLCKVDFMINGTKKDCWGIIYYSGGVMQHNCVGNCPVDMIEEGEIINGKQNGLLIVYMKEAIGIEHDGKDGFFIDGWGMEKRSECIISSTKIQNNEIVFFDKRDCSTVDNLNKLSMNLTSFICPGPMEYPYNCEILKTSINLSSSNENKITTCSDLENKINISEKGYKDIFFGMTENEFKLLGKCNGDQSTLDLEANMMGNGLKYMYLYKYSVNAVFNGIERVVEGYKVKTVSKIIVNTYTEYHDQKRYSNRSSGFVGIDEIRDILKKKYSLVSEPTAKDINLYNEFNKLELDRPKLDYVFKNQDTNNLIIYRIYNSQTKLDWFYVSEIHYLSKEGSINYLTEKKSKEVSESDF